MGRIRSGVGSDQHVINFVVRNDLTGQDAQIKKGDRLDATLNMPNLDMQNLILGGASPAVLADSVASRMQRIPSRGKLSMRGSTPIIALTTIHGNTPVAAFAIAQVASADATNSVIAVNVAAAKMQATGAAIDDRRVESLSKALAEYKQLEKALTKDIAEKPDDPAAPLSTAVVYLSKVNIRRLSLQLSQYESKQEIPTDIESFNEASVRKFGPEFRVLVDWLKEFSEILQGRYGQEKAISLGIVSTPAQYSQQRSLVDLQLRVLRP
ncbi:MAG TPA: hypothetical protein VL944_01925 [Candidatus Acidoferrum sp.]|nr:hypothetical protein [Candidatus Acidoferrum sp.]